MANNTEAGPPAAAGNLGLEDIQTGQVLYVFIETLKTPETLGGAEPALESPAQKAGLSWPELRVVGIGGNRVWASISAEGLAQVHETFAKEPRYYTDQWVTITPEVVAWAEQLYHTGGKMMTVVPGWGNTMPTKFDTPPPLPDVGGIEGVN